MARGKRMLRALFCLRPLPALLLALPAFALVAAVLVADVQGPLAYASYALSAYALAVTVVGAVRLARAARAGWRRLPAVRRLLRSRCGARLLQDAGFRSLLVLCGGLGMNLFYAALHLYSGLRHRSAWFLALAAYYLLLGAMRGLLAARLRRAAPERDLRADLRACLGCGAALLLMNQALAALVGAIVWENRGFVYPGNLIYAMAAYTFAGTISAIVRAVRERRRGGPLRAAARGIGLTAALVSMLALETAMLARFGADTPAFRRWMTAVTGGAVCALELALALGMIARAARALHRLRAVQDKTGGTLHA